MSQTASIQATRINRRFGNLGHTVIFLFALGWAFVFINRTALYPLLPIVRTQFNLTNAQAGLITSGYYLFYVLLQIPAGIAGDRFGHKRLLVATYAMSGLGVLAFGLLSTSYAGLLATTVLYGGAAGGFHPMAFSLTMRSVPRHERGLATALINSGSAVGLVLGLSVAGPLFLVTGNWHLVFIGLAAPTLLLSLLYALKVTPASAPRDEARTHVALLHNRDLVLIYVGGFCSLYAFATAVVWGPTFFQAERGLGLAISGAFTAVVAVGGIPAGLYFSRLSDRRGRKPFAITLMPMAGLALVGVALVHNIGLIVFLLLAYGATGKLAWEPIAVAWTGDHVNMSNPDSIGAALALFGTIGMTSSVIAPVVGGWIRDQTGSLAGAFIVAGALLLIGAILMMGPRETVVPISDSGGDPD